ncbi:MAG TPA: Wzz/FepE/Etk N-terminal domain-containing protein, partial [Gemmatimonadales bacterium]
MAASAEAAPRSEWQRYFAVVGRHKTMVAIITLLGSALGLVGAHFLPQEYDTKAILWVERLNKDRPDEDRDPVAQEVSNTTIDAPGWVQVVTSNSVLDSVVRRMRTYVVPKEPADAPAVAGLQITDQLIPGIYRVIVARSGRTFEFDQQDGTVLQRGNVGDSIGLAQGIQWAPSAALLPAGKRLEVNVMAPYEASQALAKDLKVRVDEGSSFLVIQLKGKDAARTAGIVNAVASRTVVIAAEMKKRRFQDLATILSDQYDHAKQNLDSAELRLRDYRIRTAGALGARTVAQEQPNVNVPQPWQLQGTMDDLARQKAVLDQVAHTRPGQPLRVEALAALPATHNSPELTEALAAVTAKQAQLRDLKTRYTDEAAPVLQLQGEIDSLQSSAIPALAASLSQELGSEQQTYRPQINNTVGQLRRIPTLELDDERLSR